VLGCEIILAVNKKLADLCVWIFFMWNQKVKASCVVVSREEKTFETTATKLSRGKQDQILEV
jgi:hypothetical protein